MGSSLLNNQIHSPDARRTLDHIAEARHVGLSQLYLRFADGLEGTWEFVQLGLEMSNMNLNTLKASASGDCVEVQSKYGEDIHLDPSSLRVLIDPNYAAEIEKQLNILATQIGL